MVKKIFAVMLCLFLTLSVFNVSLSARADGISDIVINAVKEVQKKKILEQIPNISSKVHTMHKDLTGEDTYKGWCGAYVQDTLHCMEIINSAYDTDVSGNGNQFYDNVQSGTTSTGYLKNKYPGSNCLYDIVNAYGGESVFNIVVGWANGYGAEYYQMGHVCFIHAIIDNQVYLSESYSSEEIDEGQVWIYDLDAFMNKYRNYYGYALGAVHFTEKDVQAPEIHDYDQYIAYVIENPQYKFYNRHVHNYTEYVYYWKDHPHYKCYKCSCGDIKENRDEPTYVADCPECNSHVHNYTEYVYYWKAHPHYKCYKCSCGEIKENRDETVPLDTCEECLADYKATLSIDKTSYNIGETIKVSWNKIPNATHYNLWLYKENPNGEDNVVERNNLITGTSIEYSGLSEGTYYTYFQTYNSNYWTQDGSDWFHSPADRITFTVSDNQTNQPVDIGTDFYAKIISAKNNSYLYNNDGDASFTSDNDSLEQIWEFFRLDNGAYKIISKKDKKVLDVQWGETDSGTNVWVYNNDTEENYSQEWFIYPSDSCYILKPRSSNCVLDINIDIMNAQIYTANETDAQKFYINKVNLVSNPWIKVEKSNYDVGDTVLFSFGGENATYYRLGIDKDGERVITTDKLTDTNQSFAFDEMSLILILELSL